MASYSTLKQAESQIKCANRSARWAFLFWQYGKSVSTERKMEEAMNRALLACGNYDLKIITKKTVLGLYSFTIKWSFSISE